MHFGSNNANQSHVEAEQPRAAHTAAADVDLDASSLIRADVSLHPLIVALLHKLKPGPVQDALKVIFGGITLVLEQLEMVEGMLEGDEDPDETEEHFALVRAEARSLLVYIHEQASRVEGIDSKLADVLDGTCFAIRHELNRVFKADAESTGEAASLHQRRIRAARAQGLLANCFQQSAVAIARVIDPQLNAASLFIEVEIRLKQTTILQTELTNLLDLVRQAERAWGLQSYSALIKGLKTFCADYMQYLMYRDWKEFEESAERIISAQGATEVRPLLDQFACYIETLLYHVGMRTALSEQPAQGDE